MVAPRIVILDNDDVSLAAIHVLLIAEGYRTLRCRPRDVTDAHSLVKRFQPALVILDLWSAVRADGWTFLKHLCADPGTVHIPAIIAPGQPEMPPGAAELLRTTACHVMTKPFDAKELLAAITAALDTSPTTRERSAIHVVAALTDHASTAVSDLPSVATH